MKKCFLLAVLLWSVANSQSQDFVMGLQMGLGRYKMEELKSYNDFVVYRAPIEPQQIDDYPPYYFYQPHISLYWSRFELGLNLSFQSTGSRYSLEDYSGEYRYDTRPKTTGFGVLTNYCLNPQNSVQIIPTSNIGWYTTKVRMEEYLALGYDEVVDESFEFNSSEIYWKPGLKIAFPLSFLILDLNVGYVLQLKGSVLNTHTRNGSHDLMLFGKPIHTGWNGWRVGFGVSLNFSKLQKM